MTETATSTTLSSRNDHDSYSARQPKGAGAVCHRGLDTGARGWRWVVATPGGQAAGAHSAR